MGNRPKKDGYSRQMDRLKRAKYFYHKVQDEWRDARGLFQMATATGLRVNNSDGCLTMIRAGDSEAATPLLTREILLDQRIPTSPILIEPKDLVVFAKWQRHLDRILDRTPYVDKRGAK